MAARYRSVIITMCLLVFAAAIGTLLHRRDLAETNRRSTRWMAFFEVDRQYHETQALLMGAHRGDMTMVRKFLPGVLPSQVVNAVNAAGWEGRTEIVKYLFDRGYEPNRLGNGSYLLSCAAAYGYDDLARLLRQRNVRLTASDRQEALTWAAARGHTEMARLLVEAGADVNAVAGGRPVPEYAGLTPLMLAANFRHAGVVRLLLARHAALNRLSPFGQSALALAKAPGLPEALAPGETRTYKVFPDRAKTIARRVAAADSAAAVVTLLRRAGAAK